MIGPVRLFDSVVVQHLPKGRTSISHNDNAECRQNQVPILGNFVGVEEHPSEAGYGRVLGAVVSGHRWRRA
jgi:hypothetical protein